MTEKKIHILKDTFVPYKSMITGEMIKSKKDHIAHLNHHNCLEVGNENQFLIAEKNRINSEAKSRETRKNITRELFRHYGLRKNISRSEWREQAERIANSVRKRSK